MSEIKETRAGLVALRAGFVRRQYKLKDEIKLMEENMESTKKYFGSLASFDMQFRMFEQDWDAKYKVKTDALKEVEASIKEVEAKLVRTEERWTAADLGGLPMSCWPIREVWCAYRAKSPDLMSMSYRDGAEQELVRRGLL